MSRLPRLAFGNSVALDSVGDLADRLAEHDRARSIKLPDAPRDFRGHMAFLRVGELNFGAFAHSPVTVEAGDAPGLAVMIPCFGSLTFTSQEYRFTARAGHSLALLTGPGNRVETSLDSHVVTLFDKSRLLRTSRSMLGLEDEAPVDLNLEQARAVSTSPAGLSMGGGLGNLFQTMDQLPSANLGMLGLDDVFYRTLAVILSPQVASAFVNPGTGRRPPPTRPEIDAVCDYILGHLEQPLGLTQLERVSGLSARSLQYAFRKQFQCTPMQWVSEARLGLGHRLLSAAKPGDRVAGVALSCGFTDFGAFSTAYRARYGTSPSETLRLALGRC